MRRKRKSNNPAGRPITVDASASYLLKMPAALLEAARDAAEREGIGLAEWLRRAARREFARSKKTKG